MDNNEIAAPAVDAAKKKALIEQAELFETLFGLNAKLDVGYIADSLRVAAGEQPKNENRAPALAVDAAKLTEDEQIALLVQIENYMSVVDMTGSQSHPNSNAAEAEIYEHVAALIAKRAPNAAPVDAAELGKLVAPRELGEVIGYAITAYKKSVPVEKIFTITPSDASGYLAAFIRDAIERHMPVTAAVNAPSDLDALLRYENQHGGMCKWPTGEYVKLVDARALVAQQAARIAELERARQLDRDVMKAALVDLHQRMEASYAAEPTRRITFMDMEAVHEHVARLGFGGSLDVAMKEGK